MNTTKALIGAVKDRDLNQVRILVETAEFGDNDRKQNRINAIQSAMHCALFHPTPEILEFLIDQGANIHCEYEAVHLTGPALEHALNNNADTSIIKFLIKKGADINRINVLLACPLERAIMRENVNHVQLLLASGACILQLSEFFSLTRYFCDIKLLKLLLVADVDVNKNDISIFWFGYRVEEFFASDVILPVTALLYVSGAKFWETEYYPLNLCFLAMQRKYGLKDKQEFFHFWDANQVLLDQARSDLQKTRYNLIKERAFEVCIALQDLNLDANRMCHIVIEACAPFAYELNFHYVWNLVVKVKHYLKP